MHTHARLQILNANYILEKEKSLSGSSPPSLSLSVGSGEILPCMRVPDQTTAGGFETKAERHDLTLSDVRAASGNHGQ